MLLLYISTQENKDLFTGWLEEQDIFMDFTDVRDIPSIKTAWEKKRLLANYDYILFYLDAVPLPEDDILAVVTYVRQFHHARIIVFAPKESETVIFFGKLLNMRVRELVTVTTETDLIRELSECMSPVGKSFSAGAELLAHAHLETAVKSTRPRLAIPEDLRLTIGIAGTQSRVGVTTQASESTTLCVTWDYVHASSTPSRIS